MAKKARPAKKTTRPAVPHPAVANPIKRAIEAGEGILRLAPTWVPRSFSGA